MLNFCGIVVVILKMATGRNFSIPDIEKFLPVAIFKMAATILQKFKLRICHNAKCSFKPVVSGRFGRPYIWNVVEIGQCWICAVLWRPFWKWRPVKICYCRESIRDIIIYPHIKFWWYRTMLNVTIRGAIMRLQDFQDVCLPKHGIKNRR
jgi:hypothetical protein